MPPSFACSKLPWLSNSMSRESAWGEVPWAPLQTTFCQGEPSEASPRKVLALKLEQPFAFGNGESWRSPATYTMFGLTGCAAIAPCRVPWPPGKMDGVGTPSAVQVAPALADRNTPL